MTRLKSSIRTGRALTIRPAQSNFFETGVVSVPINVSSICLSISRSLAAGNGPDNPQGLRPRHDRLGQRGVRRFVRQVLLAGEEAQHLAALLRDVVADRPAP